MSIVIPYEEGDEIIHTDQTPFCRDMPCPCHEDQELTQELGQQVQDGEVTPEEADKIYHGQPV